MANSIIKDTHLHVGIVGKDWSLSGYGVFQFNLYEAINNVMPTGARCLGIVGQNAGQNQQMITNCEYENNAWSYTQRNMATESRSGTAYIRFLYTFD